eukprot:TRINITY_DN9572_c0_g3_i2.p1 TRINITY_DN9572_c0_g3~~TRINITY_DN9572_c0_g3_i2.p1  ORF type:complete len:150 (-),score=23.09 TRINITY_DN9572_c0_g3_i2:14-463(-)
MGKTQKDRRRKAKKKIKEKLELEQKKSYDEKLSEVLASGKYNEALKYLTDWESKSSAWKFHKITQGWLLDNMYNADLVTTHYFKLLRKYLKGLKGRLRETIKSEAVKVIEHPDKVELTGLQSRLTNRDAIKSAKATKVARAGKVAALFA